MRRVAGAVHDIKGVDGKLDRTDDRDSTDGLGGPALIEIYERGRGGSQPGSRRTPSDSRLDGVRLRVAGASFGPLLDSALTLLLERQPDMSLVSCGLSPDALEAIVEHQSVDVLLVGPEVLDSGAVLQWMRPRWNAVGVVTISHGLTRPEARRFASLGATISVAQDVSEGDLLAAIRVAGHKHRTAAEGMPFRRNPPIAPVPDVEPLTRREEDVYELLRLGTSDAQIACALGIALETVHSHTKRIYRKLKVSGRRDLRA